MFLLTSDRGGNAVKKKLDSISFFLYTWDKKERKICIL